MSVVDEDGVIASGSNRSDVELIAAVRSGDMTAFGELWSRHESAARRFATSIARPGDVEELVSESFYRVLRAINGGGGPNAAFRAYLFQAMRNANVDVGRAYLNRIVLTDEDRVLDVEQASSAAEVSAEESERSAAVRAWASLPESSRTLLWHLIIEEETPAQIAPILGISPNGVSSRAVRAKERLRQAFLQQQLADAEDDACIKARAKFGAYVRGALPDSAREIVEQHLAVCTRGCPAALLEITDVNRTLRAVVAPALLGGSLIAAKYLGAGAATAAVAAGGAVGGVAATGSAAGGSATGGSSAGATVHRAATAKPSIAGLRAVLRSPLVIGGSALVVTGIVVTSLVLRHGQPRGHAGGLPPVSPSVEASRSVPGRTAPPLTASPTTSPRPGPRSSVTVPSRGVQPTTASIVMPPPLPAATPQPEEAVVSVPSSARSGSGTLSATLPAGWFFAGWVPAPGAQCVASGRTATCRLPAPTPGSHRFVFFAQPPDAGTGGTLHVNYTDGTGSITQEVPL